MATINPTVNRALQGAQSVAKVSWTLAAAGDDGAPVDLTDYADRSVQIQGSFGTGTVTIEGSNDGTNFQTLRDPQGATLSFTAAGLKQVLETTQFIRPKLTGGTAPNVVITMIARKADPKSWS